jgi:hypothetical protein
MHNSISRIVSVALLCASLPIGVHARMSANTATKGTNRAFSFTENKGQIVDQNGSQRSDIDFKISLSGMNIFLGDGQIHYQWNKSLSEQKQPDIRIEDIIKLKHSPAKKVEEKVQTYRLDVKLVGANISSPVISEEKQEYYETYYLANCNGKMANTYNKVTYKNVYPNIDWVLYAHNGELKYDFIVHPGGNPADIKLQYGGATSLSLNDGVLTAATPLGTVREQKPYTYLAQSKQMVASKYALKGNVLSFDIASTDAMSGDMVIDPTINWATYYGDGGGEMGGSVEADNGGNAYMGGSTSSISNMATIGAYQTIQGGSQDGYMVKFLPNGTRVWATYFGGSSDDGFYSIAYDPFSGSIYAAGTSESSTAVATTGAHQATYGGGTTTGGSYYIVGDAILVKFTGAGTITWSTYYGGSGDEYEASVACDGLGNVFLAGGTQSTNAIATAGAYQTTMGGLQDAFLAKFNSSGVRQWGTYFGGTSYEYGAGVTCDGGGNAFVVGETTSSTAIASSSTVYQPALDGYYDGYIAKFTAAGAVSWSTYYGGDSYDGLSDAGCDAAGNVYVCGVTYSATGIATPGAYRTVVNANYDGYVAKFNSSGTIQWGSYFGGNSWDQMSAIEVRPDGSFFSTGMTYSTTDIATTNGYHTTMSGGYDVFLTEWNSAGNAIYGTYFGGDQYEFSGGGGYGGGGFGWGGQGGGGCSWTPAGYVFISGNTSSSTGLATTGAYQTTYGGGGFGGWYSGDAFLASFIVDTMVAIRQPYIDSVLCPGDSVKIPYIVTYNFRTGNVFTAELSDPTGSFATGTTDIGTRTDVDNDTIRCQIPLTIAPGTAYRIRVKATAPIRTSGDNEINIRIKPIPTSVTATSNSPICEGATLNLTGSASIIGSGTINYSWVGPNVYTSTLQNPTIYPAGVGYDGNYKLTASSDGCSASSTTTVAFLPNPAVPLAGNNGPVCQKSPINLTANSSTPGVTYQWTGPFAFSSSMQNPTIASATTAKAGNYSVIATAPNGCSSQPGITTLVVKPPVTIPTPTGNTPICTGSNLQLNASTVAGATYEWSGPGGYTSTLQNPVITGIMPSQSGIYEVKAFVNGCWSDAAQLNVVTTTVSFIGGYASPNDTICAGTVPTFVALPANGGPTPVYQWYKNLNPIPGATSLRYNDPAVSNGDQYYCTMYSVGVCPDPVNASTDTMLITVLQTTTKPEVTLSSVPSQALPGSTVTFNAHIVNGGYSPTYQWFRNDKMIWGATYSNWTANNLEPYDKITVVGYTSDPCAEVQTDTSDAITINFPTGVNNVQENAKLNLYPNPNNGAFTLNGSNTRTAPVTLTIVNIAGQVLYSESVMPAKGMINHNINAKGILVPGVYILRVDQSGIIQNMRFTVSK